MRHFLLSCLMLAGGLVMGQTEPKTCASEQVMENLFRSYPELRTRHNEIENSIYRTKGRPESRTNELILNIPVVVHIIHNNGPENIPDAQVLAAIGHLNEAFANTGYYNPATGVDTKIRFCLAQKDPNGNYTTGINRVVSPLTVTNGVNDQADDRTLKDLARWNPTCYMNIWLVSDIAGSVVGYAYLPSSHGSFLDGLVIEAQYFGSSYSNDVVLIHEAGHYLGLYHTFQNGCSNSDCSSDGDKVCDTPPDNVVGYTGCNTPVNSCNTDTYSGFSTDQNDLKEDYMDYGNWDCMNVFTQGQKDRMRWHVLNVRSSLLNCQSCANPCPAAVTAGFTSSAGPNVLAGTTINFNNTSANAGSYKWYVNGVLQPPGINFSYSFNQPGEYVIRLEAESSDPSLCVGQSKEMIISVDCAARASFTPAYNGVITTGTTVSFTAAPSAGTLTYQWKVNNQVRGSGPSFSHTFLTPGTQYVKLIVDNGVCKDSSQVYYIVNNVASSSSNTYQKYFSNLNVNDAEVRNDGNLVLVGTRNRIGMISCVTPAGNTVWTKSYRNGQESDFFRIRRTADNGFIVGGAADYTSSRYSPWLLKIDEEGVVQWSKSIRDVNGGIPIHMLNDVIPLSNGGYVVVFTENWVSAFADLMVACLNSSGDIVWSRRLSRSTDVAASVVEVADGIIVGGHFNVTNGNFDGLLLKLNKSNGNFIWAKSYDVESKDNRFTGLYLHGNELLVTFGNLPINASILNHEQHIMRLDLNGNHIKTDRISIPGTRSDTKAFLMQADGSYTIAVNMTNQSATHVMKFSASGSLELAKRYIHNGTLFASALEAHQDGIYIAGYRAGGNMLLIKTNEFLGTPGCNETDFVPPITTVSPTVTSMPSTAFSFINNFGQMAAQPTGHTTLALTTTAYTACNSFPFVPDCDSITYQKVYTGPYIERIYDFVIKDNGNIVSCGVRNGYSTGRGCIMETTRAGDMVSVREFTGTTSFTHIIRTKDGGYLLSCGNILNAGLVAPISIVKLDGSYNIQWKKKLAQEADVMKILQTEEGDFVIGGGGGNTGNRKSYLLRLDPSGNVVWGKMYWESRMWDFIEDSQHLVFTTQSDRLAKVDKATGQLVWVKEFRFANGAEAKTAQQISKFGNHYYLSGGEGPTSSIGYLAKLDKDGNILLSKKIDYQGASFAQHLKVFNHFDSTFVLALPTRNAGSSTAYDVYFLQVDTGFAVLSSYRTTYAANEYATCLKPVSPHTVQLGGVAVEDADDMLLTRVNLVSASNNCNMEVASVISSPLVQRSVPSNLGYDVIDLTEVTPFNIAETPTYLFASAKCFSSGCVTYQPPPCDSANCTTLQITAPDTLCSVGATVTVNVQRSNLCNLPVQWGSLPAGTIPVSSSDAGMTIRFAQPGTYTVRASVQSACTVADDSLRIVVLSTPPLNLGPDMTLCPGSIYKLKAPSGYRSYSWQDGFPDSTYMVSAPGIYHIAATDYCGNIIRDTVVVSAAPKPDFDLGSDLVKCNGDSVTITAPAGYTNYTWAPRFAVSSASGRTIRVSPPQDTVYVVTAEQRDGCTVMDSIRVLVRTSPPVHLGADTSFCSGSSVLLDAGPGFAEYAWANGATTQQITAATPGMYAVAAKTESGCTSRDTLYILNVYIPRPIRLGNDTSFCAGASLRLDAGTGFTAYSWNTGAVTQQITVSTPGIFGLTATDVHGCTASDSMEVQNVHTPATINLGADTSLCEGSLLNLQIDPSFTSIRWSTGAGTRQISVADQGKYWVQARDVNQCLATDTISVLNIYDMPQNFLISDTAVCTYDTLHLWAQGSFSRYLWSTGNTGPVQPITRPGRYWLEVTTEQGCNVRAYVDVAQKDCKKELYFPTAFTPNNDGLNDMFRPGILGKLKTYELVVYNRYGEVVFRSNQVPHGWDGRISGKPQATGNFVWFARYQFEGEEPKTQKGNVILIR